jgi:uncharacterized phage protein (TIGR02218 family)
MRTIPAGFLDSEVTSLHVCWRIIRRDDEVIYGTECDRDIEITSGNYVGLYLAHAGITGSDIRSTADMSVDNLEVTGALQHGELGLFDLSAADLEAGLFDNAEATTFLVNADTPNLYQHVLRTGWLGNVTREAEGQYKTELRGLTQALSQGIVRTYGLGCDAELGDARCKVDMTPFTVNSWVQTIITQRRVFELHPDGTITSALGQAVGGTVTWLTGANTGYTMEIKEYDPAIRRITLFLPMPNDFFAGYGVGDNFTFRAGCDKKHETCQLVYNNIVNFRGHAIFVPGQNEILKVGKR